MTEFLIVQTFFDELITAIQDNVQPVSDKCQSCGLIGEETYSHILSMALPTDAKKARFLLNTIKNTVKLDSHCYYTFIGILREKLPPLSTKKLLADMDSSLQKGLKAKTSGVIDLPVSGSNNQSLTASRVKTRKSIGKFGGTVQTSEQATDGSGAVNYSVQETTPAGDGSPYLAPTPRRRTLQIAMQLIQSADMDAQQDEAQHQELSDEKHRLEEELKEKVDELDKAMKKKKQIAKHLKEEQDRVKSLQKEKEAKVTDLESQLEVLRKRLSEKEVESNCDVNMCKSCRKLQAKITDKESEYESQIKKHEKNVRSLGERLDKQESIAKEKESTVKELTEEVKKLMRENCRLNKENSDKDEEIAKKDEELRKERRKSWILQVQMNVVKSIERGSSCARYAQLLCLFVIFSVLGIAIVFVALYHYFVNYVDLNDLFCSNKDDPYR